MFYFCQGKVVLSDLFWGLNFKLALYIVSAGLKNAHIRQGHLGKSKRNTTYILSAKNEKRNKNNNKSDTFMIRKHYRMLLSLAALGRGVPNLIFLAFSSEIFTKRKKRRSGWRNDIFLEFRPTCAKCKFWQIICYASSFPCVLKSLSNFVTWQWNSKITKKGDALENVPYKQFLEFQPI